MSEDIQKPFGVIYKITNLVNGKIYIGKAEDLQKRIYNHFYSAFKTKTDTPIYRAIRKYGRDSFIFTIIDSALSETELCQKEKYYIEQK